MRKKDTVENKKAKKSNAESYRCGDCLHYQRHAHSAKGSVCEKEGIRAFAIAPKCFTPDVSVLQGNTDAFLQLSMLVNSYTPKQRRIMLAVIRDASKVKKHGYTIGTKVYFKVTHGDYLNNYFIGYVMGRTSAGEIMITGTPDRKTRGNSFMFYVNDKTALLSHADWKAKEHELREAGLINDPVEKRNRIKKTDEEEYQPPTIDSVPESWYTKTDRKEKKTKSKKRTSKEFQI